MNQEVTRWGSSITPVRGSSTAQGWDTSSNAGTVSRWSNENREITKMTRQTRLDGARAGLQAKLNMFKAELRKMEMRQILTNVDEIMNHAIQLAQNDNGKLEVFIDAVRLWTRIELENYAITHNPMLGY